MLTILYLTTNNQILANTTSVQPTKLGPKIFLSSPGFYFSHVPKSI